MRISRNYPEMLRFMAARQWVNVNRKRPTTSMTNAERDCFNQLVMLDTPEVRAVQQRLCLAQKAASRGANEFIWIQGTATIGTSSTALEAAAAFCHPNSVGHLPEPSEQEISYANVPVAYVAAGNTYMAGLQAAACEWLGQSPGRSGNDSGTLLAEMLARCGSRVFIFDDIQAVRGGNESVNSLRVLLGKLPTLVIFISLPPEEDKGENLAKHLSGSSTVAKQIKRRTRILRLSRPKDTDFNTYSNSVRRRIRQFKLLRPCPQEDDVIHFLWSQRNKVERANTLAQVYSLLAEVAALAVGQAESITLPAVMAATHD